MLTPFGTNIWIAEGPAIVAMMGFHYPTRMGVIRLADGRLLVWSPIALTDALMAEIDALGPLKALIAPNDLHHMYLQDWAAAYPNASLYGAPGLAQKRPDIAFDDELNDTAPPLWKGEVDQVVMRGNTITTEVVFFHRPSGTVLFTDLLQQMLAGWFRGWRGIVAKLDLIQGSEPRVPRKFRLAFRNRKLARKALDRILGWPAQKVLMAHGTPVVTDAAPFLRRAFHWISR